MASGWFGRQGRQGTQSVDPGSFHSYLEHEVGVPSSPSSSVHCCSLLRLKVLLAEGTPEGLLALAPEA